MVDLSHRPCPQVVKVLLETKEMEGSFRSTLRTGLKTDDGNGSDSDGPEVTRAAVVSPLHWAAFKVPYLLM